MQRYQYLIIGGGMAGGRAVDGIRAIDPDGTIALLAGEAHRPYQRPPLSKGYMTDKEALDAVYLKPEEYYAEKHADLHLGVWATAVRPADHMVEVRNGEPFHYDKLLLATGGQAKRLSLPGADLPGVFALRTIEDSDGIKAAAQNAKTALVLGGSYIGSEVAASLTQRGVQVTMVFPESRLLERLIPEALSQHLRTKYEGKGIRILPGTKPERFTGEGHVQGAVLDNGQTVEADLVVMGVGIRLNTELAAEAGLEMSEQGGVRVDRFLRTSDPDIYAAGDIAEWPDRIYDMRRRVEHWDVARTQGLRAGRNMAGENKSYPTLSYFFSDLFDLSFEVWGNPAGSPDVVLRGSLDGGSFAFFYFVDGVLSGVLAANRSKEETKAIPRLVRDRPRREDVADSLADESIPVSSLVEER